ncbi:uncharacterized protein LOC144241728 [Crocuta crocuta]
MLRHSAASFPSTSSAGTGSPHAITRHLGDFLSRRGFPARGCHFWRPPPKRQCRQEQSAGPVPSCICSRTPDNIPVRRMQKEDFIKSASACVLILQNVHSPFCKACHLP